MIRSRIITPCVMAGIARAPAKAPEDGRKRPYVPTTHALLIGTKGVGARHKAGHDDGEIVHRPDRNQL
jgi:hypothetical protein